MTLNRLAVALGQLRVGGKRVQAPAQQIALIESVVPLRSGVGVLQKTRERHGGNAHPRPQGRLRLGEHARVGTSPGSERIGRPASWRGTCPKKGETPEAPREKAPPRTAHPRIPRPYRQRATARPGRCRSLDRRRTSRRWHSSFPRPSPPPESPWQPPEPVAQGAQAWRSARTGAGPRTPRASPAPGPPPPGNAPRASCRRAPAPSARTRR